MTLPVSLCPAAATFGVIDRLLTGALTCTSVAGEGEPIH